MARRAVPKPNAHLVLQLRGDSHVVLALLLCERDDRVHRSHQADGRDRVVVSQPVANVSGRNHKGDVLLEESDRADVRT